MRPLAIAHRAGNSLARLQAAMALGADVIECDVHEHRGRLEVRHLKTAGPLPFLWDRWEIASASAPRMGLAELLEANKHQTLFMLDLKGRRLSTGQSVTRLLKDSGHHQPVLVCGRHWPSVEAVASLPFARQVLSARNRAELSALRRRLEGTGGGPTYAVSVHRSMLDAPIVAELRVHVEHVMSWPINDTESLDELLGIGVTGIISDDNDVLAEMIRRRRA